MGLVINNHMHMNNEVPGKKYFPWQQTWLVCMEWAYGGRSANRGRPPYDRDPNSLYPRQGLRFADPEGTYTIAAMDEGVIDVSAILPIDYDFWASYRVLTSHGWLSDWATTASPWLASILS